VPTPPDDTTVSASEATANPSVSIACPFCRKLVPAGAPCPRCGGATAPPDLTLVLAAPPIDDTAELDPLPPGLAAPPPPPPTRPRTAAVLGAAGVLVLVAVAAVAGLRAGSHADPAAGPGPGPGRGGQAARVVPVDAADVHAEATSTQQPDGGVTYAAANTLDGRPETAWNSDGRGAGATLVYTFAEPVDLRSITLLNGYQKRLAGSHGRVDLYLLNERVRAVTVVTDAGSTAWPVRDDRAPQTLTHAFGRTRTVRLRVDAVYPSRKYKDLAVSEVGFAVAAPPAGP
jgi:hypothetical protein